ncbi:hypothetical protein, partial [Neomesorhizobium albiziae]
MKEKFRRFVQKPDGGPHHPLHLVELRDGHGFGGIAVSDVTVELGNRAEFESSSGHRRIPDMSSTGRSNRLPSIICGSSLKSDWEGVIGTYPTRTRTLAYLFDRCAIFA